MPGFIGTDQMTEQLLTFPEYEERFLRLVGDIHPGQYGRYKGRLVRRMSQGQFSEQLNHYNELASRFTEASGSGETLSEVLIVELRDAEVKLVLEQSAFLPNF